MGIEAFAHDGRDYTYFGIFPSLIRMPILLVTNAFDGDLTAPSILVAWLTTGLFTSLMLWRLRILMRGAALVGRIEAALLRGLHGRGHGWIGDHLPGGDALHLQRGLRLEHPTDRRQPLRHDRCHAAPVMGSDRASFVLVLCANLDRTPTGYACVIGAFLIAGWLALGFGGKTTAGGHSRWWRSESYRSQPVAQ